MKYIILIISLFVGVIIVQAQNIVSLENSASYIKANLDTKPKPVYFKDNTAMLNKYIGKWEGKYKNKTYYFEITKQTKVQGKYITTTFRDDLYIKIRITDNKNKKVIYDKFKLPKRFHIKMAYLPKVTKDVYVIGYLGNTSEEIECGDIGDLYIESFDKANKLKVYVKPEFMEFYIREGEKHPCPDGRILPPFPDSKENALILTKKN